MAWEGSPWLHLYDTRDSFAGTSSMRRFSALVPPYLLVTLASTLSYSRELCQLRQRRKPCSTWTGDVLYTSTLYLGAHKSVYDTRYSRYGKDAEYCDGQEASTYSKGCQQW